MRLKLFKITNFRGYRDTVEIQMDNLTAFVGKNDVGKSSVLEALDIFFNDSKGTVKLDSRDLNVQARADGETDIVLAAVFDELPDSILIDAVNETTLQAEFLLNQSGQLEIVKKYKNGGAAKIFIRAIHPTNPQCEDLLLKKNSELKTIVRENNIECDDLTVNAIIRAAIWNHYSEDLQLQSVEIDVTKEDAKNIWAKISTYLPIYSLFQSDRKNNDSDSEVQDPLNVAVKQILSEERIQEKLSEIAREVEIKLQEVSDRTLEKIREMDATVANGLNPVIPAADSLKWDGVFKSVSITGDENIPINKRGSGIKRLVLLNFFRAEAERRMEESGSGIIYAIEEPETSQHTINQKMLIEAFIELATNNNTQVIITTHSGFVVKALDFANLRMICDCPTGKTVMEVEPQSLPYPSINEVNYLAFGEVSEEYHDELYGYIESAQKFDVYKQGKATKTYIKERQRNGNITTSTEQITLTEYIRHQIHHPENRRNVKYTPEELEQSIIMMRQFVASEML